MFKLIINTAITNSRKDIARNYGKHNKKFLYKDGVKLHNIMYYPSENGNIPEHQEPTKLFMVRRVKQVKGCPYWEKRLLRDIGLFESNAVSIVKNIPENNARLWKIKHLVEIVPISYPHGEPSEADINHTILKDNGECVVIKELEQRNVLDCRFDASVESANNEKKMDGETLRKNLRLKWLNPW
ncbi:39S ribosomal protein L30, mitochondrial [Toxorhynchites rutilus septentrionalis]|uniref:39S ribosomal protein L30, mitochondrial n=1 Tax=Toxorhynchites rutilus septentrionalis TaxID=329112 RepID=UPI00247B084A|nr:39S ribosomal protein L30, mitochondrial [Toxorhynchites rutilus septentrionalis]